MNILSPSENEITLIINPDNELGKKIQAVAKSERNTFTFVKHKAEQLTETQLHFLLERLEHKASDVLAVPKGKSREEFDALSAADLVKLIKNAPEEMRYPLAMRGDQVELIRTPTDILKLTKNYSSKYNNIKNHEE